MDIGLGIALLAGFLSFVSPCVLPIVPGYLTFITGMSFEELTERQRPSDVVTSAVIKSLPFVCGFSLVFISLGASASVVSVLLRSNLGLLKGVAGFGIMVLGFHLAGLLPIPALLRERRSSKEPTEPGMVRAFVAGVFFAFGWTPCVGPILGTILTLAATIPSVSFSLLLAYSAGLGIPFILMGVFFSKATKIISSMTKHLKYYNLLIGALIIMLGILIFTNQLAYIANFPLLNEIVMLG